jgi:hypothetical protein
LLLRRHFFHALKEVPNDTTLPEVIRRGGFELTLVSRKGKAAIYRQHWPSGNPDDDAYEAFKPAAEQGDWRADAEWLKLTFSQDYRRAGSHPTTQTNNLQINVVILPMKSRSG